MDAQSLLLPLGGELATYGLDVAPHVNRFVSVEPCDMRMSTVECGP